MKNRVQISVVMSVYNGEKYLKQAIASILNQSYKKFEFIIIDDGSVDSSLDIIKSYGDKRIILVQNDKNKGLIYSLNKGCEIAKGKYIARMDCDDIAYSTRLEEQVNMMESDSEIVLTGTGMRVIFEGIPFLRKKNLFESNEEKIKIRSMFYSTFVHPSVMIRKNILDKFNLKYEEKYKNAEDFGLWSNLLLKGRCKNIEKPLLKYRIVKKSITRVANKDVKQRKEVFKKIYKNYFELSKIFLSDKELDIHFEIAMIQNLNESEYSIEEKERYIKKLKGLVIERGFSKEYVDEIFEEIFLKTYLYENIKVQEFDSEIVRNRDIKKQMYQEKIKRNLKRIYK